MDDELERMWRERFVGKFVSLSTVPETGDRNNKSPVSRCRGSSLRNYCLRSHDKITLGKCNTIQMVTVHCVISHVAVRQIPPRLYDNVLSGQACRTVMHEYGTVVQGSSRRGKL